MSFHGPTPTAPDGSPLPGRTPDFAAPAAYPAAPTPGPAPADASPPAAVYPPAAAFPPPAAYPPPAAVPQPAAYPPGATPPGYATTPGVPPTYGPAAGAPAGYGSAAGTPAGYGAPATPVGYDAPATPVGYGAPADLPRERVGRGLLASLGGIVVGVVLTVVLWKLNFIASITSFAMAYSAIWLYVRAAGRGPAKGAPGLIAVIALGVVACLASLIVADTLTAAAPYDLRPDETVQAVLQNLLDPSVWEGYTREILMYLLFAALGTFGLIRQLGRARRA